MVKGLTMMMQQMLEFFDESGTSSPVFSWNSKFVILCKLLIKTDSTLRLVCNQPATQGQLSLPSLWGR